MNSQISQGLKLTFLIHFIIAIVFGLGFLLIPNAMGRFYGLTIQEPYIYRLLGGAMLGFAVSSWMAYNSTEWESVRILVFMETIWTVLGAAVMLYALLFAAFPVLGWLNAVIFMVFAAIFGWYFFHR